MITAGAESVGFDIVYLRQKLTFVPECCIPFVLFLGDDPVPWGTGKSTRRIGQSYRTRETSRFYGSRFSALHQCHYQRSPKVRTTNFHFLPELLDLAKMEPCCAFGYVQRHETLSKFYFFAGLPHMSTENDTYMGYFIPANTLIMGNTWCVANMSSTFLTIH